MQYAIGVDLGGTKTAAGVVSAAGEVLFSETIPTLNRDGGGAILDATAALVSSLVVRAQTEGLEVAGVGVGSAGVIDAGRGVVVSATDAILGWGGTALTAGLASRLGLDPEAVRAVNDVHAHALGEAWAGAAAGTASSLLVAFGTGVGGSFVLDGQPLLGHRYVGGHVGHVASPYAFHEGVAVPCVCGGAGHVEAIASGPAIREAYVRLGGTSPAADARAVFALAGAGDAIAIQAVGMGAAAAGQAVAGLANILDPEVVVVSGGLSDAGAPWWRPMERALRAELLPALAGLPVLPAKLGNAAAIVGAARLVLTAPS
ncbi:ROK family protein [Pseudarthrobacter sulfonivorans]|uniref:ROK family protein n=1 Tax=Pseudarthrobacter sulfonivorans TaxID=121292 RepID=UPI002859ADFF|nr:ROK family protein [Pseudarthrobacter sulfonivorans]MDR6414617.1 glucokinase [Pseudarthrobacter sulfonivorans]